MSAYSDQLRQMRREAGFSSARAAAMAMGVPVPTYLQHENGKRTCSILQFERYEIFLTGFPVVARAIRQGGATPEPDVLAATVYDQMHRERRWRDARPATMATYRDVLEGIFRAIGVNVPEGSFQPASDVPEGV